MKITFLASGSARSNFTYRVLALSRALHKQDHHVSIIAPSADKYNDFKYEKINEIDGVKIYQPFQFKTKRLEINLIPYIIGGIYRVLKERSDVIYIYKPTPVSIIGLISKFIYKTPVILDMDDLGSDVMKIEGHPWYQQKLVMWCEDISAKYADKIVVTSTYLYDIYHKKYPSKPIHIMRNGIDSDWFDETTVSEHQHRIVFFGMINRQNILEPLFDIFPDLLKKYPDSRLLIMGDGNFLSYFKSKVKMLGIQDQVEFTGKLDPKEARKHLNSGDIGYNYMPDDATTKAASNMKVPQYMSSGVLPIVSDIGDLPSYVDFGNVGYISKADDNKELEKTIIRAFEDNDRKTKAKAAREFVLKNFDWNIFAKNFIDWFTGRDQNEKRAVEKIYVVATDIPSDKGGSSIRNFNLIKQLREKRKADVELFYISKEASKEEQKKLESDLGIRSYSIKDKQGNLFTSLAALFNRVPPFMMQFKQSGIGDVFRKRCEEALPDIVHIEQHDAYYCIRPHLSWLQTKGVKIVLDSHNVEGEALRGVVKTFSPIKKLLGNIILPNIIKIENEIATKSDIVLACSKLDAEYFKRYNDHIYIVPNGVDSAVFAPNKDKHDDPVIIFIGSVSYPPNEEALKFYLKEIHPTVKNKIPEVKLLAIGATPEWMKENSFTDPSVYPLGFVESVRPYLDQALVGICSIREGSGTRLKVLTYMSSGLAVVSTHKGAEGIDYTEGVEIISIDEPTLFANEVVELLQNKAKRDVMGNKGRELTLKLYDWNVIGSALDNAYDCIQ